LDAVTNLPELRQEIRSLRRRIEPADRTSAAVRLARRVSELEVFSEARSIAAYVANEGEMDPGPLIQLAWGSGKEVYLPIISPDRLLHFGRYRRETPLEPRTFGILEPMVDDDDLIPPQSIDLVLTPLVAFDPDCHRVGMGGGYYDHTFEFLNDATGRDTPRLLGVAFELQKIARIERQPWDLPLHAVATERHLYRPNGSPCPAPQ
jgi:5-formyltetrahydrofolate cyclo-ligase